MKAWQAIAAICVVTPALAEPISGYTAFELRPTVLDDGVPQGGSNKAVVSKIDAEMQSDCGPRIAQWNSIRSRNNEPTLLVLEPHLTKVHFVNGNSRFWLGPLKGDSDIYSVLKIVDAASGNVLAQESFRGHGNGFKGMMTIGATDNHMITRVAAEMCDYIARSIVPGAVSVAEQDDSTLESDESDEGEPDLYSELIKLDDLRKRGILTDEEFQAQKQKLLVGENKGADPKE